MSEGTVSNDQLRLFMERIERLDEEKKGISDDIRDVFSEAKGQGYDTKIMRQILRLRKMTSDDRAEMEALLGLTLHQRDGRGLRLTEVGQALARWAARIQIELANAAREVAEAATGQSGVVRVGAVTGPALKPGPASPDRASACA